MCDNAAMKRCPAQKRKKKKDLEVCTATMPSDIRTYAIWKVLMHQIKQSIPAILPLTAKVWNTIIKKYVGLHETLECIRFVIAVIIVSTDIGEIVGTNIILFRIIDVACLVPQMSCNSR